jgi:dihydrofolate reductase
MSCAAGRGKVVVVQTFAEVLARWCVAEAAGDAAALGALLGAEFRGDGIDGRVLGKAQWIARHRDGELRLAALRWRTTERRETGPTAIAVGVLTQLARYRGRDVSGAFVCTLVAVRRGAGWAIVNVQLGADQPGLRAQIGHLADVSRAALRDRCAMSTPTEKEQVMSQVIADMSMSLDGFIADRDDSVEQLFGWFFGGDVEVPTATPGVSFRTPAPSAEVMRDALQNVGALVSGRRNFDLVGGWGGAHPMGVPVYVVTHQAPEEWPADGPMRFVTDGVGSAVAQAKAEANGKIVGVATPSIVRQCLDAGLLDAIHVNLVPVLLGEGIPFFGSLASAPVALDDPEIVESQGVTHLTYRIRRDG